MEFVLEYTMDALDENSEIEIIIGIVSPLGTNREAEQQSFLN